jgi:hypothetical protein
MRRSLVPCLVVAGFAAAVPAGAAPEGALVEGLRPEDRHALEAIAELEPTLRDAVLEVAGRPEVLVRVPGWRLEFDSRLAGVVVGLDDAARARIETLAPHPFLVDALLAREGAEREAAIDSYPDDVGGAARQALRENPAALRALRSVQADVAARAESALAPLPGPARDAFHRVLDENGLASLLLDHIQATVRLGAAHAQDSTGTRAELAALAREAAAAREREARERAAQEQLAAEQAERAAERARLWSWRTQWGYGYYRYPFDVYWGRLYDPWYRGWWWGHGRHHHHHHH